MGFATEVGVPCDLAETMLGTWRHRAWGAPLDFRKLLSHQTTERTITMEALCRLRVLNRLTLQ